MVDQPSMPTLPEPALSESKKHSWSDERLIRACLKNDQEAWDCLIDRYKNLIFSIPVKYGFAREDAADIFQSVCLDFIRGLAKLREAKALPKWLIQISVHACLRRRREQEALPSAPAEQIEALPDLEQALPGAQLHEIEQEQALRDAINNLSPRCRELIRMLFYDTPSRPYAEIAAKLDLAIGSIGFIRGRCLEKLRRSLEQAGF